MNEGGCEPTNSCMLGSRLKEKIGKNPRRIRWKVKNDNQNIVYAICRITESIHLLHRLRLVTTDYWLVNMSSPYASEYAKTKKWKGSDTLQNS